MMGQLDKLKIIEELSPCWEKIASHLGLYHLVPIIRCDYIRLGVEKCCRETFHRWLNGEGTQPEWEVLIEALRDADKSTMANRLQRNLDLI